MGRQCLKISGIGGEDGSPRFSQRYNDGINHRTATSETSQQSRTARERLWDCLGDFAGLQKPVFIGITTRVPLKAFDEDDGGNLRRPKPLLTKSEDQREHVSRTLCQASDSA